MGVLDANPQMPEFREGEKHGPGVYTFSDGRQIRGVWRDDKLVSGQ